MRSLPASPPGPRPDFGRGGVPGNEGHGDQVAPRPHSPLLVPVAGSSRSRRGHAEASAGLTVPLHRRLSGLPAPASVPSGVRASAVEKLSRDGGTDGRREGRKEKRREGGRSGKGGEGRGDCRRVGSGSGAGGDRSHSGCPARHASVPRSPLCAPTRPGRVRPAPFRTAPSRPFKKVGEGSAAMFHTPTPSRAGCRLTLGQIQPPPPQPPRQDP